jgi:hypothetical protein
MCKFASGPSEAALTSIQKLLYRFTATISIFMHWHFYSLRVAGEVRESISGYTIS